MTKQELLLTYGGRILCSDYFYEAQHQPHHYRSTVASHSINTALFCITIYNVLRFFHIKLNLPALIIAALAHDLGILGRAEKYSSGYECLSGHPKDSVSVIQSIIPETDPGICDAIATHMFPLCRHIPHSREGWILSIADKFAAATDLFRHYTTAEFSFA